MINKDFFKLTKNKIWLSIIFFLLSASPYIMIIIDNPLLYAILEIVYSLPLLLIFFPIYIISGFIVNIFNYLFPFFNNIQAYANLFIFLILDVTYCYLFSCFASYVVKVIKKEK